MCTGLLSFGMEILTGLYSTLLYSTPLYTHTHTTSVQHYTISRRYTLKYKNTSENLQSRR